MAIRIGDDLAKMLGEDRCDGRFENWFYYHLMSQGMSPVPFGVYGLRGLMAAFIKQKGLDAAKIKWNYAVSAVPEDLLEWVGNDAWQNNWISRWVCIWADQCTALSESAIKLISNEQRFKGREKSILLIDVISQADVDTRALVARIRSEWEKQTDKDKKYEWFFSDDQDVKLPMLTDWIRKNLRSPVRASVLTSSLMATLVPPPPVEKKFGCFADVAEFFNFYMNDIEEKQCFDTIKKRWSQIKYRNNLKGKQQCNVVLTDKSLKLLDAMADKYLLKRAQILEILIRSEAEQNHYVSKWINVAKSLE